MRTLVLKNKILSYSTSLEGSSVLSNELVNLLEENEQLHEKRISLLYGLNHHKKEITCKIFDEYGPTLSGEFLRFRAHYHLYPHPKRT
jgi:hypothetical protein